MATPSSLDQKKAAALGILRSCGSVLVAVSGGVDSAVLLALALEALGPSAVLGVTGRSASVPVDDLEDARAIARLLRASHEYVNTYEIDREAYRANAGDRCYHCRTELFTVLGELARQRGIAVVAYGAIPEDLSDLRPGMAAAAEHRVLAPLVEAGFSKDEIRELARRAALPVQDKPASACLSSRIPVGTEVTPERLARVGRAEAALRALGLGKCRVRHHGDVARIELEPEGDRRLADPSLRRQVVQAVKEAGFRFVALDLEGYRTGSLNLVPGTFVQIGPSRNGGQ